MYFSILTFQGLSAYYKAFPLRYILKPSNIFPAKMKYSWTICSHRLLIHRSNQRLNIFWNKNASVMNRYRLVFLPLFPEQSSPTTFYILLGIISNPGMILKIRRKWVDYIQILHHFVGGTGTSLDFGNCRVLKPTQHRYGGMSLPHAV